MATENKLLHFAQPLAAKLSSSPHSKQSTTIS